VKWASSGLIGTVLDGESIPLIQCRVEDAGFKDIDIIPLGADKVFIHSLSGADIVNIVNEARHFFDLIFSNLVGWNNVVIPFQRGAWIRLYGIPLHAWNENFFKLCVIERGRYLRTDKCSLNRERFDYARVLIATSSLDVLNGTEQLLVDGSLVEIKVVEEWGFNLGDDVCLFDEDNKSVSESQDVEDNHHDLDLDNNASILADKIIQDLVDAEDENSADSVVKEKLNATVTDSFAMGDNNASSSKSSDSHKCASTSVFQAVSSQENSAAGGSAVRQNSHVSAAPFLKETVAEKGKQQDLAAVIHTDAVKLNYNNRRIKSTLNSGGTTESFHSGPWSVEWLENVQQGDIGLVSSKNKRLRKVGKDINENGGSLKRGGTKVKAGGILRHPALTLKKMARLPSTDRQEVLKVLHNSKILRVLKQNIRNRKRLREKVTRSLEQVHKSSLNESSSSASVHNDWKHWAVLHGNEETKAADVQDIGTSIGVSFKGSNHNNFSVLSRMKKVELGSVLTPVLEGRAEVSGRG